MEQQPQYRFVVRLVEYNPGKRERYVLRIQLTTTQVFESLPCALLVDHIASGAIHRFHIRGFSVLNQVEAAPIPAAYVEDIVIESDGTTYFIVSRGTEQVTIPITLERGRLTYTAIASQLVQLITE